MDVSRHLDEDRRGITETLGSSSKPRYAKTRHMKIRLLLFASATIALAVSVRAGSLEIAPKETAPPSITQSEPWQFTIAVPGLMPSINGTLGVRGVNANIDVGLGQI